MRREPMMGRSAGDGGEPVMGRSAGDGEEHW